MKRADVVVMTRPIIIPFLLPVTGQEWAGGRSGQCEGRGSLSEKFLSASQDTRYGLFLFLCMCLCLGMTFESVAIFFQLERKKFGFTVKLIPRMAEKTRKKASSSAFLRVDYVMPGVHLTSTSGEIMYFLTVQAGLSQGVVLLAAESMLTIAEEHSRPPKQGRENADLILSSAWLPGTPCARADSGQASRARP